MKVGQECWVYDFKTSQYGGPHKISEIKHYRIKSDSLRVSVPISSAYESEEKYLSIHVSHECRKIRCLVNSLVSLACEKNNDVISNMIVDGFKDMGIHLDGILEVKENIDDSLRYVYATKRTQLRLNENGIKTKSRIMLLEKKEVMGWGNAGRKVWEEIVDIQNKLKSN